MPAKAKAKKPAPAAKKPAVGKTPKYVYLFGKKTDGDGSMNPHARRRLGLNQVCLPISPYSHYYWCPSSDSNREKHGF